MYVNCLINEYYKSCNFERLNPVTQNQYIYYLAIIALKIGQKPINVLEERSTIIQLRNWIRDMAQKHPRKAKYMCVVISILINWAYDDGILETNNLRFLKVYIPPSQKTSNHWEQKHIDFALRYAPEPLKNLIIVGLETGLRQGTMISLKYEHIRKNENGMVYFLIDKPKRKHSEKPRKVIIPLSEALKAWLEGQIRKNDYILNGSDNQPWNIDKLGSVWKRFKKKHNILFKDVTLHGLRKTTVTRLANSGCSVMEISALLGWSIDNVNRMLDDHYYTDKMSVVQNAINKLNQSKQQLI